MAFLDNSGDIILDAVLTDTGRYRLAKGDGSFRVKYFALSDDEIDYTTYNRGHASGSAYYDLEIMQTPILEAFTDNRASMKYKLLTINNRELLHLPVLRLNEENTESTRMNSAVGGATGENQFGVVVNETTRIANPNDSTTFPNSKASGVMDGVVPTNSNNTSIIIDQGLVDTVENTGQLPHSLIDSAYLIEIDDRLGSIVSAHNDENSTISQEASFIDDDNIATYFVSSADFVTPLANLNQGGASPIDGRKGTRLKFRIRSHVDLADGNVLFNKIGKTVSMGSGAKATDMRTIDTTVRVTGAVTGRRIDIPVRFFKTA
tara:strand:+ start:468 stop:1424 length:957 start_codon:yes stop_codon:yes gene_type:complete